MRSRIVAGLPIRRLAKPSSCPVESRDRRHEHHRWAPRVHTSARASCAGQRIYRPRGLSSPVRCALTRATESSSGGVGSAARRNERECDNQNDGHTHRVLRSLSISGGGRRLISTPRLRLGRWALEQLYSRNRTMRASCGAGPPRNTSDRRKAFGMSGCSPFPTQKGHSHVADHEPASATYRPRAGADRLRTVSSTPRVLGALSYGHARRRLRATPA